MNVRTARELLVALIAVASVSCGLLDSDEPTPAVQYASVSAGEEHTCGVKTDGSVECWGWNQYGASNPPAGSFASVSAGHDHTCGLKTDGSIECRGGESIRPI